jgi:hypothetical protein
MAQLTITLTRDGPGGGYAVRVGYRADADTIPFEHEVLHRQLVLDLFPWLEITDARDAAVRVEREKPAQEPALG